MMKRSLVLLMAGFVLFCLSSCGSQTASDRGDVEAGNKIPPSQFEEKGFCGRYTFCSGQYAYDMRDGRISFKQYDFEGNFVRECGEKKTGKDRNYTLLTVNDRELFFGEDTKDGFILWNIPLKNKGKESEVPDWENPKKMSTIPELCGENITAFYVVGDTAAGFFDGKYAEFDLKTGEHISVGPDGEQEFYDFASNTVDRDYSDYETLPTYGSDIMECGAVLLTTAKAEEKGDLYLHGIGSGTVKKVAENVYNACELISGQGKFIYWGITADPNSYWHDKFDGIWICDAVTGQQEQILSKMEADRIATALSAGELFMDESGRLYFEVSADEFCGLASRKILSCPMDQPNELRLEKKMTEKLQNCQEIKAYCENILFFEDGDGYEEYIYRYDMESGKITEEPEESPYAYIEDIC